MLLPGEIRAFAGAKERGMRIRVLLTLAVFLLASPAFAGKIYIDYDKNYDRSKIKTYAWKNTAETSVEDADPLLHSLIVNGIEHYLTIGGLAEVESDPDIYVTYHGSSEQELSVNTASVGIGVGYPSGWGYGPYGGYGGYYGSYYGGVYGGTVATSVTTYQVGTLVIDIWDPKTNKMVWRGIAAELVLTDNPGKTKPKIDRALEKMVKKWQKAKKKGK
jgi:hypothetical protein